MIQLWQITTPIFCGGVVTRDGIIIQAAPCFAWMRGKSLDKLRTHRIPSAWQVDLLSPITSGNQSLKKGVDNA